MNLIIGVVTLVIIVFMWLDISSKQKARLNEAPARDPAGSLASQRDIAPYLEAFAHYESTDPWAAKLVLRNAVLQMPQDTEALSKYMDHLLGRADVTMEDLEESYNFLVSFAEYTVSLDHFSMITNYRDRIRELENELIRQANQRRVDANTKTLSGLQSYLLDLELTETDKEAQGLLERATLLEAELDFPALTAEQEERYRELKDEYQKIATQLGDVFHLKRYQAYNASALCKIKTAFDAFTTTEKAYARGKLDIADLMVELAPINPQYLSPELLTYFNYVYGYIFSKINDEAKYRVTEIMTLSDKDIGG